MTSVTPVMLVVEVVVGALVLAGAVIMLLTSIALMRARDAITRVNALSPATALGVPLIVVGTYGYTVATTGFSLWALVRLVVTIAALLVVSSMASNALARATIMSGAPIDPETSPNELAEEPGGARTGAHSGGGDTRGNGRGTSAEAHDPGDCG